MRQAKRAILVGTLVHLALATALPAQLALYWDGDGIGIVGGGPGTWDTTLPRWSTAPDGSTYQAWVNANEDDAFFTGTGGLVTLSGPLTARSLNVHVPGYTFGPSGSITLAGSSFGTIHIATGVATMSANLAGASGFTKTGAGTLVFTANSTTTGNRRIHGGAVNIDTPLRIPSSGTVTLDGGMLVQTNPTSAGSYLQSGTALDIGAGGGTVSYTGGAGSSSIYAGTIRGPGVLHKVGAGEFRYQGSGLPNTTYSKLYVQEGLFRLGFASSTQDERGFGLVPASFLPDAITLDGGAIGTSFNVTFHPNRGIRLAPGGGTFITSDGAATFQGAITGVGGLSKRGTQTLRLTASSDFLGPFTLLDNRVEVHANNALGLGHLIFAVTGNGTLANNGPGDVTLNNPVVNLQSGSIDISATANRTLTLTGKLTGPANWKRDNGTSIGTVVLTNSANDFTGNLLVSSGRLVITADGALGSTAGVTTINSAAQLGIRGGIDYTAPERVFIGGQGPTTTDPAGAIASYHGNNRFAGSITMSAHSNVRVVSDTLDLAGPIAGTFFLFKNGAGTLVLSNPSNSFGTLSINEGTLVASADGNFGAVPAVPSPNRLWITDNTALRTTESFTISPNRGLNIGAINARIDVVAGTTLTYDGTINNGVLNKIGGGTLTLGGTNVYEGATNVHAGTLSLKSTGVIPNDLVIEPDGALHGNGSVGGNVTVRGTIAPGSSTGILATTGNHQWSGGGTYEWEVSSATGSPGVDWDQLTMSALTVTATSKERFRVKVIPLPGKGGPGLDNFDPDQGFSWVIAVASTGNVVNFDLDRFEIDVTQFEQHNTNKGGFYLSRSGGDLMLNYVPEPASGAVLLGAAALLGRRRGRASSFPVA